MRTINPANPKTKSQPEIYPNNCLRVIMEYILSEEELRRIAREECIELPESCVVGPMSTFGPPTRGDVISLLKMFAAIPEDRGDFK